MSQIAPTPIAPDAPAERLARRLTRAVVAVTLVVLAAGATVTSTGSGDAVPTWPWGWFSDHLGVRIEMSHRVVAGLLVLATIALVWAAARTKDPGLKRIAWIACWTAVAQAVLGGVRVLLPGVLLKVSHATLAQLFFCLAVAAAAMTSTWWKTTERRRLDDAGLAMLRASGIAFLLLFVQLVLGVLGRHDVLPREVHAVFALPAIIFTARVVLVASGDLPRDIELFRAPVAMLGFFTALQIALGIASYIVTMEVPDVLAREPVHSVALAAHLAVGAIMLGLVLSVILRTVRLWGVPTDERVAEARAASGGASVGSGGGAAGGAEGDAA